MPANTKYLSTPLQKFLKLTAGLLGGYLVTATLHLFLGLWVDRQNLLITMAFSGFIIWASLFVIAFLAKNGWKIWGIYLLISLIFFTPFAYKIFF
nr:hypothetical protein [Flavobacterium sp. HSC-61S13]